MEINGLAFMLSLSFVTQLLIKGQTFPIWNLPWEEGLVDEGLLLAP